MRKAKDAKAISRIKDDGKKTGTRRPKQRGAARIVGAVAFRGSMPREKRGVSALEGRKGGSRSQGRNDSTPIWLAEVN